MKRKDTYTESLIFQDIPSIIHTFIIYAELCPFFFFVFLLFSLSRLNKLLGLVLDLLCLPRLFCSFYLLIYFLFLYFSKSIYICLVVLYWLFIIFALNINFSIFSFSPFLSLFITIMFSCYSKCIFVSLYRMYLSLAMI